MRLCITVWLFSHIILVGSDQDVNYTHFSGRQYSHCTDSFSIFGFLAFLLALLDLILELQGTGMMMMKRSIRDSVSSYDECKEHSTFREATSAAYTLLRGFLNALSTDQESCAKRFICEATHEASNEGPLAQIIAKSGSLNAVYWLKQVNSTLYSEMELAIQDGLQGKKCVIEYPCEELSPLYRNPTLNKHGLETGSQNLYAMNSLMHSLMPK